MYVHIFYINIYKSVQYWMAVNRPQCRKRKREFNFKNPLYVNSLDKRNEEMNYYLGLFRPNNKNVMQFDLFRPNNISQVD